MTAPHSREGLDIRAGVLVNTHGREDDAGWGVMSQRDEISASLVRQ